MTGPSPDADLEPIPTEARLRLALENALEGMREMLPYVPDHFREKWSLDLYVVETENALKEFV